MSKVPLEVITLQVQSTNGSAWNDRLNQFTITDQYFAMPLYQLLNDEMIDFDKPELPRDDLEFLTQRYCSLSKVDGDESSMTRQEKQEAYFHLFMRLREENSS